MINAWIVSRVYFLYTLSAPALFSKDSAKVRKNIFLKNIFFLPAKNFPQIIENTREIIENMSEIFWIISDIFFATYTPADFQVLGRWPFLSAKTHWFKVFKVVNGINNLKDPTRATHPCACRSDTHEKLQKKHILPQYAQRRSVFCKKILTYECFSILLQSVTHLE